MALSDRICREFVDKALDAAADQEQKSTLLGNLPVLGIKERTGASTLSGLPCTYEVHAAYVLPILAAFRALIDTSGSTAKWKTPNGFAGVLEVWDKIGFKLARKVLNRCDLKAYRAANPIKEKREKNRKTTGKFAVIKAPTRNVTKPGDSAKDVGLWDELFLELSDILKPSSRPVPESELELVS